MNKFSLNERVYLFYEGYYFEEVEIIKINKKSIKIKTNLTPSLVTAIFGGNSNPVLKYAKPENLVKMKEKVTIERNPKATGFMGYFKISRGLKTDKPIEKWLKGNHGNFVVDYKY